MNAHFSSFTPEAMRALGQDLAADFQRRTDFLKRTREHTFTMLAEFRRDHQAAEQHRRRCAEREADARRLFVSELKSGVHALLGRFELSRKEVAGDLREMAGELRSACDAFRDRPGRQGGSFRRGQRQEQAQPIQSAQPFQATTESREGAKGRSGGDSKPGQSKKRHG